MTDATRKPYLAGHERASGASLAVRTERRRSQVASSSPASIAATRPPALGARGEMPQSLSIACRSYGPASGDPAHGVRWEKLLPQKQTVQLEPQKYSFGVGVHTPTKSR